MGEMKVERLVWPRPQPSKSVDWRQCALLVIDSQNYLMDEAHGLANFISRRYRRMSEYYLGRITRTVVPNIERLLNAFRLSQNRNPVIYFTVGPFRPDSADYGLARRRDLQEGQSYVYPAGTVEHQILPRLRPQRGEVVLNKITTSAFNSTGVDRILRNLDVNALVFVGAATNVCVESTLRDAYDLGYSCVLVEDACASFTRDAHEGTVANVRRTFGRVVKTDDVVALLDQPGVAHPSAKSDSPNGRSSG